ncbi:MAG TPA: PH domain-containing protein, partial [Stackebrandtia sp.]
LWESWPGEVTWHRVSPRLVRLRLLALAAFTAPATAIAVGLPWLWWGWGWGAAIGGAVFACCAIRATVLGRAVRAWGYAERDEDLLVRHGLWTRRLSIVPYGRMQFVDVSAGPLERSFDLATVQLHTAAATTDATVPGLEPGDAAGLRDRLAERATAEREGL